MASVRCSPKKRARVELPETGRRSEVEMAIGLYAKTGWVVAKEFELSPVYQIIVKHQWKPSITNQMQKNVNEVLAQGKLPTYGTSIDQVVPQYSRVGAFGRVCLKMARPMIECQELLIGDCQ